jgi:hypothetical protein
MRVGRKAIPDEEKKISISITLFPKSVTKLTKIAEEKKVTRGEVVEAFLGDENV